jgi:hypothetical protein
MSVTGLFCEMCLNVKTTQLSAINDNDKYSNFTDKRYRMSTNESFSLHIWNKASLSPCNYSHQLVFTFSQLWLTVYSHMLWNMIHIWRHFTLCNYVGSVLLIPVATSGSTFWDVMLYCLTEANIHFAETYCLHLQEWNGKQAHYSLLAWITLQPWRCEAAHSSIILVNFYQTKWHHILEGSIITLQLKASPVTVRRSPQGCGILSLQHFHHWLTDSRAP